MAKDSAPSALPEDRQAGEEGEALLLEALLLLRFRNRFRVRLRCFVVGIGLVLASLLGIARYGVAIRQRDLAVTVGLGNGDIVCVASSIIVEGDQFVVDFVCRTTQILCRLILALRDFRRGLLFSVGYFLRYFVRRLRIVAACHGEDRGRNSGR
jgi:hypothetical protein